LDTIQKHIVIIEDDTSLSQLLGKILQQEGYRVTSFGTFTTIDELVGTKADCVLLDEHLPNITGHIICILLKSKPQTKAVPVILMSADAELQYFAELSCADAYVQKPFDKQTLINVLNSVL
jgi:DNA-binding response OmpR family regulator